ncbi:MAG: chorismate synthase [Ignavibacteria bacterium]|nr:chorismate synthase [Ignavibacteria bacterium]
MAGNSFGNFFRIMTFGESHGKMIGVVIDGLKPNLEIDISEIQRELDRRRPGQSSVTTQRKESDTVQVVSGIFEGKTTGTPICMIIKNEDYRTSDYENIKNIFRPGHGGYTFLKKYGIYDYRGGGRTSGRETAARVAAGAVAKQLLKKRGIKILAYTKQIGDISIQSFDENEIEKNPVRCPDKNAALKMIDLIEKVKREGDSVGGVIEIKVQGLPAGYGEPVFDKLEADFAKALMSIGAVRGFEIGSGFKSAEMKGSECNDQFRINQETGEVETITNHSGGVQAGISNGAEIIMRIAVKPTSSISKKQRSVTYNGQEVEFQIEGRHDPCICPRIVPVAESMTALVLIDHILMQEQIQNTENKLDELRKRIDLVDQQILLLLSARNDFVKKVAQLKKENGIPVYDEFREKQLINDWIGSSKILGLSEEFVKSILELIISESRRIQKEIIE